jgi:hypothetical protein
MSNILQGSDKPKFPGSFPGNVAPPVILSVEMAALLGKSMLAAGEKPLTNVDLAGASLETVTPPFRANNPNIATMAALAAKRLIVPTFVNGFSMGDGYIRQDQAGIVTGKLQIGLPANTTITPNLSTGQFVIATGLPPCVGNSSTGFMTNIYGPYVTLGGQKMVSMLLVYVDSAGDLRCYVADSTSITNTLAAPFPLLIDFSYLTNLASA